MRATTLDTYLAFAALVQLGRQMFTRSRSASLRPATTAVIALYATVAAAIATHMVSVEQLSLRDELVLAEPWRLVGCLLAYERVPALACHLWLLLLICEPLERALGSRRLLVALLFCSCTALALRSILLQPPHQPELLAAAPLFAAALLFGQMPAAQPAAWRLPWPPKLTPWVLFLAVFFLEGIGAALPCLLGIGAGALYESVVGLPPPPPPPPPPAAPAAAADGAADGAPTGAPAELAAAAAGGAAVAAPTPKWVRVTQGVALLFLLLSIAAEAGAGGEARQAAQAQCGQLVAALDLSDARVAQMVSNFTADRPELSSDREMPLRAFEWLALRWRLRPHAEAAEASAAAARQAAGEEESGGSGSSARAARQALYDAQLAREVKVMVDEVLPAIETNAAPQLVLSGASDR